MNSLLIIFIVVTALAVVLQTVILACLFFAVKRSSSRVEAIASDLHLKISPILETSRDLLDDLSPKLRIAGNNLAEASGAVRSQAERLNLVITDVTDRTHAKLIQIDRTLSGVLTLVERTAAAVQKRVMFPMRQMNGILHAAGAAIGSLMFSKSKAGNTNGEHDDLFI